MSYVHAILGPTGVGKTALATRLARETNAPTVVADRIQCYRDLATTSARSDGGTSDEIVRLYLDDRVVADGDYPAEEAVQSLVHKLERLTMKYRADRAAVTPARPGHRRNHRQGLPQPASCPGQPRRPGRVAVPRTTTRQRHYRAEDVRPGVGRDPVADLPAG